MCAHAWEFVCAMDCIFVHMYWLISVSVGLCALELCAAKQLNADQYSLASVRICQGWSENSA